MRIPTALLVWLYHAVGWLQPATTPAETTRVVDLATMAKQAGPIKIKGTVYGVTYYKMDGKYYARTKSSLTGKRVKKDPAFKETMRYASLLGSASKLASKVYQEIPKARRKFSQFRKLTGIAMQLMKEQKTDAAILKTLRASLVL